MHTMINHVTHLEWECCRNALARRTTAFELVQVHFRCLQLVQLSFVDLIRLLVEAHDDRR